MTRPVVRSGSLAQQILARTGSSGAVLRVGVVVAVDAAGGVTVNVGGNLLPGLLLPAVPLQIDDSVLVARQGDLYYVVGVLNSATLPISGTVSAIPTNSATITLTTSIGTVNAGWLASYTPTIGDVVWLSWLGSTPVVLGKQGVTGVPPAAAARTPTKTAPTPPPDVSGGSRTFTAIASGTWRGGQWLPSSATGGHVLQGDYGNGPNSGAWFYGGLVRSSLAGMTVTGAQVWLARPAGTGTTSASQPVHLCRVTQDRPPGDLGGLTGLVATSTTTNVFTPVAGDVRFDNLNAVDINLAAGQSGWFDLPLTIAQALVDQGGSLGVRPVNPYLHLAGVSSNPKAGAIRLTWRN